MDIVSEEVDRMQIDQTVEGSDVPVATVAHEFQLLLRVQKQLRVTRGLLRRFRWTETSLMEREGLAVCPVDAGHRIPRSACRRHVKRCKMRSAGYSVEDISVVIPSSRFFYEGASNVVRVVVGLFEEPVRVASLQMGFFGWLRFSVLNFTDRIRLGIHEKISGLDEESVNRVIHEASARKFGLPVRTGARRSLPLTFDQEVQNLAVTEREAVYDYVVKIAEEERTRRNLAAGCWPGEEEKKADHDALLQAQSSSADIKIRRTSSKKKTVHVGGKSYIEELRDVIASQMSSLVAERPAAPGPPTPESQSANRERCQDKRPPKRTLSRSFSEHHATNQASSRSRRSQDYRRRSKDRQES